MAQEESAVQEAESSCLSVTLGLDQLEVPALVVDPTLRVKQANALFLQLTGRGPETVVGQLCHTLIGNRDCPCRQAGEKEGFTAFLRTANVGSSALLREVVVPLQGRGEALILFAPESGDAGDLAQYFQAQKLASLGVLAAGVAHELRNPLAIISTSLFFLSDVLSNDDQVVQKHLRIMQEEIEAARRTIEDLLNFARPSPNMICEVDPNQVLTQVLSLVDKELLRSDIEIRTRLGHVPMVVTSLDVLKHAFLNILTNAMQAMPNGGTLFIESELTTDAQGRPVVCVRFRDTGVGMSDEELAHALDPFFTTKPGGTGLGLSITYANLRRIGGDLRIRSKAGKGTTVELSLPVGG